MGKAAKRLQGHADTWEITLGVSATDFLLSEEFMGPRKGFIFRSGDYGTGYYVDDVEMAMVTANSYACHVSDETQLRDTFLKSRPKRLSENPRYTHVKMTLTKIYPRRPRVRVTTEPDDNMWKPALPVDITRPHALCICSFFSSV